MTTHHRTDLEPIGSAGDPIPDPGIPPHEQRLVDIDPTANRRAERQVAMLFALSSVATILFIVGYIAYPLGSGDLEKIRASNMWLGAATGVAMLGLGAGAIHWSKKVMTSVEIVQERHALAADPQSRMEALDAFEAGTEESGFARRTLIRNSLIGAMALLPLPALVLLRDLGPLPGDKLEHTIWAEGVRVVTDITFTPIRPAELQFGSIVNAMPENFEELPEQGPERMVERAKVPVILIRMEPEELTIAPGRENWQVDGILCYSKICTHVGCPINLYEQVTHNLLCPCHQSTFDLADNGKVVFGPAARNLPQLPLFVDDEGYLAAQSDFTEPVGPTFWERDR
jgi:ubiquinol-cytochrome c reductase iron-sulfur subunit